MAPTVEAVVPAVVVEGEESTVSIWGTGFPYTTAVFLDDTALPFDPGGTLKVDLPATLPIGAHQLRIETQFGEVFATVHVANVPGQPATPSVEVGPGQAAVSWLGPDDGGSPITGFEVRMDLHDGGCETTGLEWTAAAGLTNGHPDGTFRPADPITRQALAAFQYRRAVQAP